MLLEVDSKSCQVLRANSQIFYLINTFANFEFFQLRATNRFFLLKNGHFKFHSHKFPCGNQNIFHKCMSIVVLDTYSIILLVLKLHSKVFPMSLIVFDFIRERKLFKIISHLKVFERKF
jgi:hypothetical protein